MCIYPAKVFAQDGSLKLLQEKFKNNEPISVQEKLYLHTDKQFYLAGEIVWFKIYVLDAVSHQPINISKLAYVEILDRNSKPVLQSKISLSADGGSGSIYLPLTVNTGNYILRAYTNWMKNGDAADFYEQKLSIINTIKTPENNSNNEAATTNAAFFPEGGHLVNGVETKVAFRITGSDGKGQDVNGILMDEKGDTVLQFSPRYFGIGHFIFTPQFGKGYQALIHLPGNKSIVQKLPKVESSGYIMNVKEQGNGTYNIQVNAKSISPGQRGETVTVLAHTRQSVKWIESVYLDYANGLELSLDKNKLGEGVSHITLFNSNQQPVAERLVFKKPVKQATASINFDKNSFTAREQIDLTVLFNNVDTASMVNSSLSVYQLDDWIAAGNSSIKNYLWISDELKEEIESPGFYFSNEPGVQQAADDLMLTHGWRRFNWDNLQQANSIIKFTPEFRGHFITAKITQALNEKPAANVECFLAVPSSPFGFYSSKTDSLGVVHFDVKDYYGMGEIIIKVRSENQEQYKVEIITPFSDQRFASSLPELNFSREIEQSLLQKSIAMQAQNIYRMDSIRKFDAPYISDTLPFYGKADFTYMLDDYKRFTTMEEVLREYVTPITLGLKNGQLQVRMFDEFYEQSYDEHMLFLLDGVPILDANKIISYDPLKVKKLELVPRQYMIGPARFNGIASFETIDGKFDGFELDPSIIAVDYEGLQLQREFYSPRYENDPQELNRIPDLRTTLFWLPNLKIKAGEKNVVNFFTSDLKGKFLVVLEGISSDGKPVSASQTFSVQ